MLSEEVYEKVTRVLEEVGFEYDLEIVENEDRWKDFCLQIAAMMQYGIEITSELVDRIMDVVRVTIYTEPEQFYIL